MQMPKQNSTLKTLSYLLIIIFLGSCAGGQIGKHNSDEYRNGMVVTAHPEASRVGLEILKKGGNAVDAAVAVQFALAVVYPNAGNIGGGGFMVYRSATGETATLDFREKAPATASRDMYLDATGNAIVDKSLYGHLAAGVPGSVAGMVEAHKKYGKLKWEQLVEPAILLARNGFDVTERQAKELAGNQQSFTKYNTGKNYFIKSNWATGDRLVQEDLAKTLEQIRDKGREGFYEGSVAELIAQEMKANGGLI